VNAAPLSQGAYNVNTSLNEIELAARWAMSPKTLQRWRSTHRGPEYLKLGKKVQYPLTAIEDYENQIRTNIAFTGAEEILLFLQQAGQADLNQIRAVCLGGEKSSSQIKNQLYRLTRCTPPRVKATMLALEPSSPVMTVIYSLCSDDAQ
jgi:hypothetical protein